MPGPWCGVSKQLIIQFFTQSDKFWAYRLWLWGSREGSETVHNKCGCSSKLRLILSTMVSLNQATHLDFVWKWEALLTCWRPFYVFTALFIFDYNAYLTRSAPVSILLAPAQLFDLAQRKAFTPCQVPDMQGFFFFSFNTDLHCNQYEGL